MSTESERDKQALGLAEQAVEGQSTDRLLALSDGVFAIVITLLVLELRVPHPENSDPDGVWKSLVSLVSLWPSLLGFVLSFIGIGIMWHNHCVLFRYIKRSDPLLITFNTLLLMLVAFIPFATALLAAFLPAGPGHQRAGALVYSAAMTLIALGYNLLWSYVRTARSLLDETIDPRLFARVTRRYRYGPVCYLASTTLALVHVPASLTVVGLLAVYFSLPYDPVAVATRMRRGR